MNFKPQSSVFKLAAIGAVIAGALLAAGAANARGSWSVQIGTPGYVVGGYPAPYYAPPPVYVAPRPVYVAPPVVYARPRVVYYAPRPRVVYRAPYWHRRVIGGPVYYRY